MYFVLFAFALYLTETYAQGTVITPLPDNTVLHGQVELNRWQFYNFSVRANIGWTLKVVHAKGVTGYNDIDIYVLKEAVPDREKYTYTDLSLRSEISITGTSQSTPTYYIVGVFGFRGSKTPFTIRLDYNNGCPDNCNEHGGCSNGVCICRGGYTGTYCQYTTEVITLGTTYTRTLNQSQWAYFTVLIFTANTLNAIVNQLSGTVNLYIQWEREPQYFTYQYAAYGYYNNHYNISITEPHLGTWYLGFNSPSLQSTFSFEITEARVCPMRCSLHGRCVGTYCRCQSEYTGLSCEEIRSYMTFQKVYSGFVDQNYWNFYKFAANSQNSVEVLLTHSSSNDCDLYIKSYSKPTRFIYSYRDIVFGNTSKVVVPNPEFSTWWVAVYGVTPCEYQLSLKFLNNNNCPCVHGQCVESICKCNPGYIGQTCDQQATQLLNGVTSPTGNVTNGQWSYYQINVTSSQLNVVLQEKTTSGMVWIYIARETSPTLTSYYAADNNSGLPTHRLSLEFVTLQTHTFIIGVYGSPFIPRTVEFTLVAWYPPF